MRFDYPDGATPIDADEAQGLVIAGVSTRSELNALEQANILTARLWALRRKHGDVLSITFIQRLHRRMFDEIWKWAGEFRKTEKNLGVEWYRVAVELKTLCDDATYWIQHDTYDWHELGARFHHRLVSIHPFPNGNGRHARLMTDVLLYRHGQRLFDWGVSSLDEPGAVRQRYIQALRAADQRDYTLLIKFVRGDAQSVSLARG